MGGKSSKPQQLYPWEHFDLLTDGLKPETKQEILGRFRKEHGAASSDALDEVEDVGEFPQNYMQLAPFMPIEAIEQMEHDCVCYWLQCIWHGDEKRDIPVPVLPGFQKAAFLHLISFCQPDGTDIVAVAKHGQWVEKDEEIVWWFEKARAMYKEGELASNWFRDISQEFARRRRQATAHAPNATLNQLIKYNKLYGSGMGKEETFSILIAKFQNHEYAAKRTHLLNKSQLERRYRLTLNIAFFDAWRKLPSTETSDELVGDYLSSQSWLSFLKLVSDGFEINPCDWFVAKKRVDVVWRSVCDWWPKWAIDAVVRVYPPDANEFSVLMMLFYNLDCTPLSRQTLRIAIKNCRTNPCTPTVLDHATKRSDRNIIMRFIARWKPPVQDTNSETETPLSDA